MEVKFSNEDRNLKIKFIGELDHHTIGSVRGIVDETILREKPKYVIIDFGEITFMDSSGIAAVIGRYRLIKELGGHLEVINTPVSAKKIFSLSGVEKFVKIS